MWQKHNIHFANFDKAGLRLFGTPFSKLANELNLSVKTIETHQMRIKEKLGPYSASELRQKAREWLVRSALNRIREKPEPEQPNGVRVLLIEIRPHLFELYVFKSFQLLNLCSRRKIRQSAARNSCVQVK
jgi:hypothetical protein